MANTEGADAWRPHLKPSTPVLTLAGAVLLLVPWSAASQAPQDKPIDPALAQRGAQIYEAQKCALCHAIGGVGNARGPLDDAGDKYAREELRLWMLEPQKMEDTTGATRRPRMPAYARLSQDDLTALVEYMASLRRKAP